MNKMIYLKKCKEKGSVYFDTLWLGFKDKDGNCAFINLNELAEQKPSIIKKAIKNTIKEYLRNI